MTTNRDTTIHYSDSHRPRTFPSLRHAWHHLSRSGYIPLSGSGTRWLNPETGTWAKTATNGRNDDE